MGSDDFVLDQTADGRRLKVLPVVDEFTRECLTTVVGRSLKAADVGTALTKLFALRGCPAYLRSDHGPEFVAAAVKGGRVLLKGYRRESNAERTALRRRSFWTASSSGSSHIFRGTWGRERSGTSSSSSCRSTPPGTSCRNR